MCYISTPTRSISPLYTPMNLSKVTQRPPGIIFDLDNTLLECGQFYIDCQETFIRTVSKATGLPNSLVQKILHHIDVESMVLPDGFKRERFPKSFRAASLACGAIAGNPADIPLAEAMYEVGDSVFIAPYPLYPGVKSVLRDLSRSYKLALATKGDKEVQWRKIRINGLHEFFREDNTYIVLEKTEELYKRIVEEQNLIPEYSWVIGDSVRDDIGPGKAAGLRTIRITTSTGNTGYETKDHIADLTVDKILDILHYIPQKLNFNVNIANTHV